MALILEKQINAQVKIKGKKQTTLKIYFSGVYK